MMTNPLKSVPTAPTWNPKWLTAAEMAAVARENGDHKKFEKWTERARELGEPLIPPGYTVRFIEDEGKRVVPLR